MSLAQKLQQGGQTPTLYNFYGKQYDYNDLAKAADQGLNNYLQTLKRGEKDEQDFRNAYNNMMSGIKDGSITFEDGHFHDKQGRYTNTNKKSKDYYGLIANYIYNNMGKSDEYKAPEDTTKIKWDNDSVKKALMKQLFNSDTGSIQDFLELDKENNGVRSIANRSTYLSNAFQNIADNWDNTFQGYTDADKQNYLTLLTNAAQALKDGTIDEGDYLALSKAAGGMDFRAMLATGSPTTITTSTSTNSVVNTPQVSNTAFKMKNASLVDTNYDSNSMNKMSSILQQVKPEGLISILRNSFYNPNYKIGNDRRVQALFGTGNISSKAGVNATLNALYAQNFLINAGMGDPNVYYIPGLKTTHGTGWVWNRAKNTITEMNITDIPAAAKHFGLVASNKQGGVLKAQSGAKIPFYNGLADYDPNKYKTQYGRVLYGINNKGVYGNPYGNNGKGTIDARYHTDSNYSDFTDTGKNYATSVENQQYYKDFTNALTTGAKSYLEATDKSSITPENNVFYSWARAYDKSLPAGSTASFFDSAGKLRNSWGANNKDSYMRGPNDPTTNLIGRITQLRNDQLLANAHNDYIKEGTRYFYKDANGTQHWVDPEIAKSGKYQVSTNGIKNRIGNVDWTDYELTGASNANPQPTVVSKNGAGTNIDRTQQTNKESWWNKEGKDLVQSLSPYLVGAGRLADSLHTNNKVADTVKQSLRPVLKNPYELYSPVTGAFSEMQFRNRQAADLRRQANNMYTANAENNTATSLEANNKANEYEYQGKLADDKEILRTQQEALKRAEANKALRNEVANYNNASINQTGRELAQLEASRLKSNWQSRDNFAAGIEADLRQKLAQRDYDRRLEKSDARSQSLNLDMSTITNEYKIKARNAEQRYKDNYNDLANEFQIKLQDFLQANGENANYYNQEFYKDYIRKQRALRDAYYAETDQLARDSTEAQKVFIESLRNRTNKTQYDKKGGKLSLSSINILNKIMSE